MPSDTRQLVLRGTGAAILLVTLLFGRELAAQPKPGNIPYRTPYPDIPRIETHSHLSADMDSISYYHTLRESMMEIHDIDLAMCINRNHHRQAAE